MSKQPMGHELETYLHQASVRAWKPDISDPFVPSQLQEAAVTAGLAGAAPAEV